MIEDSDSEFDDFDEFSPTQLEVASKASSPFYVNMSPYQRWMIEENRKKRLDEDPPPCKRKLYFSYFICLKIRIEVISLSLSRLKQAAKTSFFSIFNLSGETRLSPPPRTLLEALRYY